MRGDIMVSDEYDLERVTLGMRCWCDCPEEMRKIWYVLFLRKFSIWLKTPVNRFGEEHFPSWDATLRWLCLLKRWVEKEGFPESCQEDLQRAVYRKDTFLLFVCLERASDILDEEE